MSLNERLFLFIRPTLIRIANIRRALRSPKRSVLCTNCGYLGWRILRPLPDGYSYGTTGSLITCTPDSRRQFQIALSDGTSDEYDELANDSYTSQLHCYLDLWTLSRSTIRGSQHLYVLGDPPGAAHITPHVLRQPRKCRYFIRFDAAFTPAEHKELYRDRETRRAMMLTALISAAIGAGAAILGTLIAN